MSLLAILLATALAGICSVFAASWLLRRGGASGQPTILGLAAGALLGTALMHLLPEALEADLPPPLAFGLLLASLVFFFLLDKAELLHGHARHATADMPARPRGSWVVLAGDGLHATGDGVLIAAAFAADPAAGCLTALAVLVHEIPHHMADLVVLLQGDAAQARSAATRKLVAAGSFTVLGGVLGYALLTHVHGLLPYSLVVAAGSFLYVALAGLVPQLQHPANLRRSASQVACVAAGILVVTAVTSLEPAEHHHHAVDDVHEHA